MLYEDIRHPDPYPRQIVPYGAMHLGGDEVTPPRRRGDADVVLEPPGDGRRRRRRIVRLGHDGRGSGGIDPSLSVAGGGGGGGGRGGERCG